MRAPKRRGRRSPSERNVPGGSAGARLQQQALARGQQLESLPDDLKSPKPDEPPPDLPSARKRSKAPSKRSKERRK